MKQQRHVIAESAPFTVLGCDPPHGESLKAAARNWTLRFFHHLRQKNKDVVQRFASRCCVEFRPCVRKRKTPKTSITSSATTRTRETRCVDEKETAAGKQHLNTRIHQLKMCTTFFAPVEKSIYSSTPRDDQHIRHRSRE